MSCPAIFVKDPERYLKTQEPRIRCAVRPDRAAVIDTVLRARVNHELYYFSDLETLARFKRKPLRYCGTVTDPVSKTRFSPTWRSPRFDYRGQPYFFMDERHLKQFKATPERYAARTGG